MIKPIDYAGRADAPHSVRTWVDAVRASRVLPFLVSLLIAIGISGVCITARSSGWLEGVELKTYDAMLAAQPRDERFADQIVVVGLTEDDLHQKVFGQYPISDESMAVLLEKILEQKPRAVGVDIFRDFVVPIVRPDAPAPAPTTKPTTMPTTGVSEGQVDAGRAHLQYVWTKLKPSITQVMQLGDKAGAGSVPPPDGLPPTQAAFADYIIDDDGALRRAFAFEKGGRQSFAMRIARQYLASDPHKLKYADTPDGGFTLGKAVFPPFLPHGPYQHFDDDSRTFLLDWRSPHPSRFVHLSGTQIMTDPKARQQLQGKVVLVGNTAVSIKDFFITPLDTSIFSRSTSMNAVMVGQTYGVDGHAATVHQLIRSALTGVGPMRSFPRWTEITGIVIWAILGATAGFFIRRPYVLAVVFVVGVMLVVGLGYLLFVNGRFVPVVPPVVTWGLSSFFVISYMSYRERNDRTLVESILSRSVSRDVAKQLWRERDQILADGRIAARPLVATVLFTDLKGFSSVSENMQPAELMAWLNELMDALSRAVDEHGGFVNKYIGDAVMAVFGVPLPRTTEHAIDADARNAVRCALQMRRTLAELNRKWIAEGRFPANKPVGMRVGIYTGPLVAGSLGSAQRMEYTVIGDTVNTAARLESFDKSVMDADISADNCRILIGLSTQIRLDATFRTRCIGEAPLTGKQQKVEIHGVIGIGGSNIAADTTPALQEAAPS